MKNRLRTFPKLSIVLIILCLLNSFSSFSQVINVGFENCDFTGWTGTHCLPDTSTTCAVGTGPGTGIPCIPGTPNPTYPDPFKFKTMLIGSVNQAVSHTPENSQFIMNSGYDSIAGGTNIPVVFPGGGTCSARLGNAQAAGGGESLMYKFPVLASDTSFTYNYAVVLSDGGSSHATGQQPFFKVRMWVYNSSNDSIPIDAATFDIDGNTAPGIGGFVRTNTVLWKTWSPITIPIKAYIGKYVSFQFIIRDCCPDCDSTGHNGTSGGSHFAYVYLDAGISSPPQTCNPPSAPMSSNKTICSGNTASLSAIGSGTLSWYSSTGVYLGGGANYTTPVLTTTTKYYVQDSTCAASAKRTPVVVTVSLSTLTASASANSICVGNSVTLTGSGATTYTWSNGVTNGIRFFPTSTINYTLTGTDANNCSASYTITVSVNSSSAPTVIANSSANTVCAGVSVALTGSGASTYAWTGGVSNGLSFIPTSTTTYTVTGTDGNNCSNFDTITIKVNDITTTLNGMTITANQNGAVYHWLDCNNNFASINGETNQSYIITSSGNYAVVVNANGCNDTSVCTAVTLNCYAYFTTTYDTFQNTFTLKLNSTTTAFANSYYWHFGDGDTSTLATPTHLYTVDTVYNVCLKIKTASNDSCTYCHVIGKDYLGNIYRTSGFTINVINPNLQTGVSSILSNENSFIVFPNPTSGETEIIFRRSLNNINIKVFNVTGQKIFEKTNISGNRFNIDISNQTAGVYFIEILSDNSILRGKLIKE